MLYYETNQFGNSQFTTSHTFCHMFPLHFHRQTEIHYCFSGYETVEIGNTWYTMPEGSACIIFPYQLHQFGAGDGLSTYLCSVINTDYLEQYSSTLITKLPINPIIPADLLPIGFREMFIRAHNMCTFPGPCHSEISGSLLKAIVGEILSVIKLEDIDKKSRSISGEKSIKRILEYCTENAMHDISLDSISNALFLNKHYISHIFSSKIGMSFNEFINTHRIHRVCNLLQSTDRDILDIAYECGFHNQGTFNRVFKQQMKMSPSEYRNSIKL